MAAAILTFPVGFVAFAQTPRHLDLLVGLTTGTNSAIYVVDSSTGQVRGLLSGTPGWPVLPRGSGAPLSQSWCSVAVTRDGRIFAGGANNSQPALIRVDPGTGNRAALSGTWQSPYKEASTVVLRDQTIAIVSGQFTTSNRIGTFHSISLASGGVSPLAGGLLSDGPAMSTPVSFALCSRDKLVVADFVTSPLSGLATFEVDLQASSQRLLTTPGNNSLTRYVVSSGAISSDPIALAQFGSGESCNQTSHPIGVAAGRIYFSAISLVSGSYIGGIVEIDSQSGNRHLVLGDALDANGAVVSAQPTSGLSNYHALPCAFQESPAGELLIGEWDPTSRVVAFDPVSRAARVVADFGAYFAPANAPRIRGLAIYTNCPADINLDGVADDADFTRFASAYDILDCADAAMPLPCPSDLNADGVVDDLDFQVFVLGYDAMLCE
ncbi:MAG: hypothetical protein KF691_02590 [Phycisphaeraceae bacterium]|nr:hypothetical protein [Phycisphaeraceae bacterium]